MMESNYFAPGLDRPALPPHSQATCGQSRGGGVTGLMSKRQRMRTTRSIGRLSSMATPSNRIN